MTGPNIPSFITAGTFRHLVLATFTLLHPAILSAGTASGVYLLSPKNLEATRARLAKGDASLQPAFEKLKAEADKALKMKPLSVMDKPRPSISGDKHDYFSYGPYWWPDPTKPDGLPFIVHDGKVNPENRKGTDKVPFDRTCDAIETLGLAYFFTGHEPYASHAALLARTWFLDPATRMNPNLEHAQAIPGRSHGRGIGIIESRVLPRAVDGLALLDASPAWTTADQQAFATWLADFHHWLLTSDHGRKEQQERNNHGTWYDVQAGYLALALGHADEAKKRFTDGLSRRLATQIEPDGSQPHELNRTKPLGYSLFNLEAFLNCAQLAENVGVDWWHYATTDGRSLHGGAGLSAGRMRRPRQTAVPGGPQPLEAPSPAAPPRPISGASG